MIIITIISAYIIIYGFLAGILSVFLEYDFIFENPFYFSPVSLRRRTNLNNLGITLMTIFHFIVNPLYCLFLTLIYIVEVACNIIYAATHN